MRCVKCHTEFSTDQTPYCPNCGTPVRPLLPPLPPRGGLNGCVLGCLISAGIAIVAAIVLPIVLATAGALVMDSAWFRNVAQQASIHMEQAMDCADHPSSACKYTLVGTTGAGTEMVMTLDEPSQGALTGNLYVGENEPLSVNGTISPEGDVALELTDADGERIGQWTGVAVTNPSGIAAIQGSISPSGERFYLSRR